MSITNKIRTSTQTWSRGRKDESNGGEIFMVIAAGKVKASVPLERLQFLY